MSATKQPEKPETEEKPTLHKFHVGKYDVTVMAATAQEAIELAEKQAKKEDK